MPDWQVFQIVFYPVAVLLIAGLYALVSRLFGIRRGAHVWLILGVVTVLALHFIPAPGGPVTITVTPP